MRTRFAATAVALIILPSTVSSTGAAAAETPTCGGQPVTMLVQKGPDPSKVVYGTPARDVILALQRVKEIRAGAGDDVVCAPAEGGTAIVGEDGNDTLIGGAGPDVLIGGAGTDTISGGAGANVCDEAGSACIYDAHAPVLVSLAATSATTVDTSTGPATVRFRLQVSDQLGFAAGGLLFRSPLAGVTPLYAGLRAAHLVSGTERDGLYEVPVTVPQGVPATTWSAASVTLTDGRGNSRSYTGQSATITQTAAGDTEAPVIASLEPVAQTTVDTSEGPVAVRFRLRVTDATGFASGWLLFRSPTMGAASTPRSGRGCRAARRTAPTRPS